jgi:tRNA pseudouridine38-40 synthase
VARYFIELGYQGTRFHGWQLQNNAVTVQQELDAALSMLLQHPVETTGCGRTDTGVHASQFFAHFDTGLLDNLNALSFRLNAICGPDILVHRIIEVDENAHARFDATKRSYCYYIARQKPLFHQELMWYYHQQLDIQKMNEAAELLLQYKDYSCFSKTGGQQFTNLCTITEAKWIETSTSLQFRITSNRFLRGMVRAITGTLLQIGNGVSDIEKFRSIIESGDRTKAGPSVPAKGLFLEEIVYPYIQSTRRTPFDL